MHAEKTGSARGKRKKVRITSTPQGQSFAQATKVGKAVHKTLPESRWRLKIMPQTKSKRGLVVIWSRKDL